MGGVRWQAELGRDCTRPLHSVLYLATRLRLRHSGLLQLAIREVAGSTHGAELIVPTCLQKYFWHDALGLGNREMANIPKVGAVEVCQSRSQNSRTTLTNWSKCAGS